MEKRKSEFRVPYPASWSQYVPGRSFGPGHTGSAGIYFFASGRPVRGYMPLVPGSLLSDGHGLD
jgi:hypothetical protein